MAGYDLHTHSTLSDGTTEIEDNVAVAATLGLEGIGITDHDTLEGFERALRAAPPGLEIVPGTEFSAELDGWSVHLLGFWMDPVNGPLVAELSRLRNEREDRARRIVEKLQQLGIDIRFDRVVELAGAAPIGRPHIAQAVVEAGAARDVSDVFARYLADDGPAYVEKHAVSPVRAVELLVAAGGVAVLAHPGLFGQRGERGGLTAHDIEPLVEVGLAGIEADHPDHDEDQRRSYRKLAASLDLIVTAGSDYHGDRKPNELGSATTPREAVEALKARIQR